MAAGEPARIGRLDARARIDYTSLRNHSGVGDVIVSQTAHLGQPEHLRALSDTSRIAISRTLVAAPMTVSLVEPPLRHVCDAVSGRATDRLAGYSSCLSGERRELAT